MSNMEIALNQIIKDLDRIKTRVIINDSIYNAHKPDLIKIFPHIKFIPTNLSDKNKIYILPSEKEFEEKGL